MSKELQKRIISSIFIIPITLFIIFQGSLFFASFLVLFFLGCSYEWVNMNKNKIIKLLGILYLAFAFFLAYLLREKFSLGMFILILIICVFTDLGGYIFGKILKGPKLTKISPKKTYAGAFGGFILSIIIALLFTKYTELGTLVYSNLSIWIGDLFDIKIINIFFIFVLFISLVSQVGDLIISYFKRLAKVKDTGNLIPGHGGLLDRVDGIIFAIPASYLLIII